MMIRPRLLQFLTIVLAASSPAAEVTVEQRSFSVEKTFTATAMPTVGCRLIGIESGVWADYQITSLADHGSRVSSGSILIGFDSESIDRKLEDTRRALESGVLTLAQTERELRHLEETTPHKLEAHRRAAEIAREENSYFTNIRRKAAEESAGQKVEQRKQMLSNQLEELRQLTKMYEADDLTEETEEIILTRQKDDVATAEFALRMETLDRTRTLEVTLPREAVTLANNERDTAIALLKAEQDLPQAILLKKIELAAVQATHLREKDTLGKLELERAQFEIKAPADGWFYHGPIENGRWTPAEALKVLFKHGRPVAGRPLATFVPATTPLTLVAFLDEATARSLKPEKAGIATLAGREDIEIPVKLGQITAAPAPDNTYRADLSAAWPEELTVVPGNTAQISITAYHQPAAIFVPTKALVSGEKGWTVEVKLADGKTERRPVKGGRISGENTEILSGLEVGQVVIVP